MTSAPPSPSSPPPTGAGFLSAHDAAYELTLVARRFAAAFSSFAARSTQGAPGARIRFATASRVLGEHAQLFAALVPESVLLAPVRAAAAVALLPAGATPVAELGALDQVLADLQARATPVADPALQRAAARARADLADLVAAVGSLEESPRGR